MAPATAKSTIPVGKAPPLRLLVLLTAHLVVALVALVGIGGATRVMEAGLACPDWPLCYGVLLPGRQMNLQVFLEWFHRLDAFLVGLALLTLWGLSFGYRTRLPHWLPWSASAALVLVAFQGGLGALTVIHLLESSTVTAHLATGLALVLLMSAIHQALQQWIARQQALAHPGALASDPADCPGATADQPRWWLALAFVGGVILFGQCVLGGLMASQWSADRCFSAGEGCRWLLLHRLGAWPASGAVLMIGAGSLALPRGQRLLRVLAGAAVVLLLIQVALGLTTLRLQLAVPAVTVLHQLVAALLVALIGAVWGISLDSSAALFRFDSQPVVEPHSNGAAPSASNSSLKVSHG